MTEQELLHKFRNDGLRPAHATFAAKFFADGSRRVHVLRASLGMGKSYLASLICSIAATSGAARRILVFTAHAPIREQFREMISRSGPGVPVQAVDRRRFREMETGAETGQSPWSTPGIAVLAADLSKYEEIANSLATATWDLIVVDEADHIMAKSGLSTVAAILRATPDCRVLLLAGLMQADQDARSFSEALGIDAGAIETTAWSSSAHMDWEGKSLHPALRLHSVKYRRGADEASFLNQLQERLSGLPLENPRISSIVTGLLNLASSSIFSLEQSLFRLRHVRNDIAHSRRGHSAQLNLFDEQTDDIEPAGQVDSAILQVSSAVEPCITSLEAVTTDTKCEALLHILERAGADAVRVCVFSRYRNTVQYLETELAPVFSRTVAITTDTSEAVRHEGIDQFNQAGGVLLISDAAAKGIEISCQVLVHYDLPATPAAAAIRATRVLRRTTGEAVDVYILVDESGSLDFERTLASTLETAQRQLFSAAE